MNDPLVICDNLDQHKPSKHVNNRGAYVRCNRVGDLWVCPVCKKSWPYNEVDKQIVYPSIIPERWL